MAVLSVSFIHVSIAVSQTLLGIGIVLLLVFRRRLEFPRIWIPLIGALGWTIAADVLSPDPWTGRAQIRKFFVFLFIPLVYGVFSHRLSKVKYVLMGWVAAATASGAWSFVQYVQKYQAAKHAGKDFYVAYLERRITGFESHWMTFGALQLSVLSLLLAHWFFSKDRFPAWVYALSGSIFSAAIVSELDSQYLGGDGAVSALPALVLAAEDASSCSFGCGTGLRGRSILNPGATDVAREAARGHRFQSPPCGHFPYGSADDQGASLVWHRA